MKYKLLCDKEFVGFFNVLYDKVNGRQFTIDVINPIDYLAKFTDADGHINESKTRVWLEERIIPKTRIGLEDNLREMGLTEYDELAILKYTGGESLRDKYNIDFFEVINKS